MKKILLFIVIVFVVGCQRSQIEIGLNPKSGSNAAGFALLSEKNGVVELSVTIRGLDQGIHAIHLHEKADCSSVDGN